MKCFYQTKTKCTGRGILYDGEKWLYVSTEHFMNGTFNQDAAKQRPALAKKVGNNPKNLKTVYQSVRNA